MTQTSAAVLLRLCTVKKRFCNVWTIATSQFRGCTLRRTIASQRHDEGCPKCVLVMRASFSGQWRMQQMDPSQPILPRIHCVPVMTGYFFKRNCRITLLKVNIGFQLTRISTDTNADLYLTKMRFYIVYTLYYLQK